MFCINCGALIKDNARFCSRCGAAVNASAENDQQNNTQNQQSSQSQQSSQNQQSSQQNQQSMRNNMPQAYKAEPYNAATSATYTASAIPASSRSGGLFSGFDVFSNEELKDKRNIILSITIVISFILSCIFGCLIWDFIHPGQIPYSKLRSELTQSHKYEDYTLKIVNSDVSQYPHVKLYFSLTDSSGKALEIDSPTAAIREKIGGGKEVERLIHKVERIKDNQGVNYEILLDKSGSMDSSIDTMKKTMSDFVRNLNYKVGDKGELISFDSYLMYMATYTNDKDRLLTGIDNMTPYGMTALYDALYTGVTNASNHPGFNCVIAFTDGLDNESTHTADEVIALAKEKGMPVYLIGTSDADSSVLQNIANETNGYFWDINSISDMKDVMNRIRVNQDNVYCLEYDSDSSTNPYVDRVVSALLADSKNHKSGGIGDDLAFKPVKKKTYKKGGSRFVLHKVDVTWTEANSACMQDGGYLVTLTDKRKETKVINMAKKEGVKYVWIGGYTSQRENGEVYAHWVTGEKVKYQNWLPGEPSRNDKDGEPEFYLMLWRLNDEWSWNDQRDNLFTNPTLRKTFSGKTGYVCEVNKY
ncbi:VWA domain-containing protein [Gardnerella sp. DNF00753]|uniref:VWA domain-containing protein n=1 Tax=unclassified Gardnerella TaxID=2628112 RepID=UPI003BACD27E